MLYLIDVNTSNIILRPGENPKLTNFMRIWHEGVSVDGICYPQQKNFTDWLLPFMLSLLGKCFCLEHLTNESSSWWLQVLLKGPRFKLTAFPINSSEPKALSQIFCFKKHPCIKWTAIYALHCWYYYYLLCSKTVTVSIYATLFSKLNQICRLKRNGMTWQGKTWHIKMFDVKVCLLSIYKQSERHKTVQVLYKWLMSCL